MRTIADVLTEKLDVFVTIAESPNVADCVLAMVALSENVPEETSSR